MAMCVAALRVEKQLDLGDVLLHMGLVALALLLLSSSRMEGYTAWRNVAVVGVAVAIMPALKRPAVQMLGPRAYWASCEACFASDDHQLQNPADHH